MTKTNLEISNEKAELQKRHLREVIKWHYSTNGFDDRENQFEEYWIDTLDVQGRDTRTQATDEDFTEWLIEYYETYMELNNEGPA